MSRGGNVAELDVATSYMNAVLHGPFTAIECTGEIGALEIAAWSDGAERTLGYAREEVIGRRLSDTILRGKEVDLWRRLCDGQGGASLVIEHLRKDGRVVACEWFHEPVRDAGGAVVRRLFVAQDVTGRGRPAAGAADDAMLLRAILDHVPIVACKFDREGVFTFHDGKGLEGSGVKPGQLIGKNVFDLYGQDPAAEEPMRRALAGEAAQSSTESHGVIWRTWLLPALDERGAPNGAVTVSFDVTDVEQRDRELRAKLDMINAQQQVIRALSTPIIEVWDRVLTLPMVGVVDSVRTSEVMDNLLGAIVAKGARFAILDLTGVDAVDTKTASYLIELVRAIRLLGAEGVITGIRSNVAQTMIALGLDLSGIITMGNLRAGLKLCIQRMNAGADATAADGAGPSRPVAGTGRA
ncbi:PAS domain-containing protein [Sorangium sp. So ce260]|uniref:PAS domain-containing protein n=1 Tax=Sorangium sp. So ce260 TaxID=3133291 RepID=UPI003F61B313